MKKTLVVLAVLAAGVFAAWPWLADASQMMRIRALMGAVSVGVFLITLLAIRGYKLREKYAVLWLATAATRRTPTELILPIFVRSILMTICMHIMFIQRQMTLLKK